ncbi:MAG: pseudouridine synthase [Gammaproteobacteria bacterium]
MGRQADANAFVPLPVRAGVAPSYLWLPPDVGGQLLPFLVRTFPAVSEASWRARIARGEVVDGAGRVLAAESPLRRGMRLWYYREVEEEAAIPFEETILFMDAHLLVVDKPHFLPMTPGGRFVQQTLLTRLKHTLGETALTPIHRLDRETAGVVIFSRRADSRGVYQRLFQLRAVRKTYEALAAPMAGRTFPRSFPFTYRSRMVESGPFFLMREEEGEPNSETEIDVIGQGIGQAAGRVLYQLKPHTGRKHQLRVHMAALGAPIDNDAFYPVALPCKGDDFSQPLKLLARAIEFTDPLTGELRRFASARSL